MSLRSKFISAIVFINLIAMFVVYILTQNILIDNASQLEVRNAHNTIERTSKIVQKRIETLANVARDYSVWDDTYQYIEEQDEQYIQSNYIDETFSVNNLDVVAIYSLQNERIFSKAYQIEHPESAIYPILNELLLHANNTKNSGIYLNNDGTMFFYALHPVTTSDESALSNGNLIMMRQIGEEEMSIISEQAGRDITWLPFEQQNQVSQQLDTTTAAIQIDNIGAGTISVSANIPRDITKNIIGARDTITIALIAVTLLATIGTFGFVNYHVLQPVDRIVTDVQNINNLGNNLQFVQLHTHDEFERLSKEINQMLTKLKTSQDQVVYAQSEIAKQKAIEEKKDEFFSIASHELRTPLTAIRGNVEFLKNAYAEILNQNSGLNDSLNDMHSASMRLITLVNDFLTTARIDQNKMKPTIASYDAFTAVSELLQDSLTQSIKKGISLTVEKPTQPLAINVDYQFLQHILENLVSNSLKFTPKGGSVKISINSQDQHVVISIIDTGRGIAQADQTELFQRFRQATRHPLARDTTQGSGLGLYIARKMARAMKCDVDLLQSDVGKGSTFIITIPKAS